jgi:putative DNA primase/helicase
MNKRFSPENIPHTLKSLDHWLLWRLETRGSKKVPTKVPYDVKTGYCGKSNDRSTWASFDAVAEFLLNGSEYDGAGYAFSEDDGLSGIDVDLPWDSPEAQAIMDRFKETYCEKSPGKKLRIFLKGKPRRCGKGTTNKAVEVYDYTSPRYLTVTGDWIEGTAREVTEQQEALDWLHERYFKPKEEPEPKKPQGKPKPQGDVLSIFRRPGSHSQGQGCQERREILHPILWRLASSGVSLAK